MIRDDDDDDEDDMQETKIQTDAAVPFPFSSLVVQP